MLFQSHVYVVLDDKLSITSYIKNWHSIYNCLDIHYKRPYKNLYKAILQCIYIGVIFWLQVIENPGQNGLNNMVDNLSSYITRPDLW